MFKVNICCYFSYGRLLENVFDKTLSDNSMTQQMKKILKIFVMGDDNSFKSFTFFIYVIPVFFYIKIFRCGFVNFEICKLQSCRKYIIYIVVFPTEGLLEVAIESWPECDLNPRPLNSVQTL